MSLGAVNASPAIAIAHAGRSARAGAGNAPPVLLLPGFAASERVLAPLARYLRRELRRPVVRLPLGDRTPLHLGDVRR
jgi:pimeloyl-ACP methyl ester carboxylesterase